MRIRKLSVTEIPRISSAQYKTFKKIPLIVVLDNIRSNHNTGAIFRTCDAFACEGIHLTGITGKPPHREINKTALGATETVDWQYFESTMECIEKLKSSGYIILALEIAEGSIPVNEFFPEMYQKYALILGHEVNGIDQEILNLSDQCLEIPQYGTKHSLNVSVSGGIAIWELAAKLRRIIAS